VLVNGVTVVKDGQLVTAFSPAGPRGRPFHSELAASRSAFSRRLTRATKDHDANRWKCYIVLRTFAFTRKDSL